MSRQERGARKEEKLKKPFASFASLREIKMSRQVRGERKEEKLKKHFASFAPLREK